MRFPVGGINERSTSQRAIGWHASAIGGDNRGTDRNRRSLSVGVAPLEAAEGGRTGFHSGG